MKAVVEINANGAGIPVRVPPATYQKLKKIAAREKLAMGRLIELAIDKLEIVRRKRRKKTAV